MTRKQLSVHALDPHTTTRIQAWYPQADVFQSSSSTMSPPKTPPPEYTTQPYLLVPNLHVTDPSVREMDLGSHPWMVATVIEDEDLMFGGKPLSAWYEEERRRQSLDSRDEEERRGRQRERPRAYRDGHHHGHKPSKDAK